MQCWNNNDEKNRRKNCFVYSRKCGHRCTAHQYICETEMLFGVWMRYGLAQIHWTFFPRVCMYVLSVLAIKYRNDKNFRNTGKKKREKKANGFSFPYEMWTDDDTYSYSSTHWFYLIFVHCTNIGCVHLIAIVTLSTEFHRAWDLCHNKGREKKSTTTLFTSLFFSRRD